VKRLGLALAAVAIVALAAFASPVAGAGITGVHDLLSVMHRDTVPHTPVLGDIIYVNSTPAYEALAGNATATKMVLTQTGTGAASAPPVWEVVAATDCPTCVTTDGGTFTFASTLGFAFPTGPANSTGYAFNVTSGAPGATGSNSGRDGGQITLTTAKGAVGGIAGVPKGGGAGGLISSTTGTGGTGSAATGAHAGGTGGLGGTETLKTGDGGIGGAGGASYVSGNGGNAGHLVVDLGLGGAAGADGGAGVGVDGAGGTVDILRGSIDFYIGPTISASIGNNQAWFGNELYLNGPGPALNAEARTNLGNGTLMFGVASDLTGADATLHPVIAVRNNPTAAEGVLFLGQDGRVATVNDWRVGLFNDKLLFAPTGGAKNTSVFDTGIQRTGVGVLNVVGTSLTVNGTATVLTSRSVNTSSPLAGGGALSADLTLTCATCGVTGTGLGQFASTTSAQLATLISDETGTDKLVYNTSPVFTTGVAVGTTHRLSTTRPVIFNASTAFTNYGTSNSVIIDATNVTTNGWNTLILNNNFTITTSGTSNVSAALLYPPTISAGAGTPAHSSTLQVTGAPSVGTAKDAVWVGSGTVTVTDLKSTTGARYVCVDTNGTLTSQVAACVGT
jgi:hypothetical protein